MNEDLSRWDAVASEWVLKIAPKHAFRDELFKPTFSRLLDSVKGKAILDLGCGEGTYTDFFAKLGAEVTAVDGSAKMLLLAKEKYPDLKFLQADLLKPLSFPDKSFDIVIAHMVLVSLSEIKTMLSESRRVLKSQGFMIVSVHHPCFGTQVLKLHKSWLEKLTMQKPNGLVSDYYQTPQTRSWEKDASRKLPFYHRTLEQYSSEFRNAGFGISELIEPHDLPSEFLEKNPKSEYVTRLPRFLFFKLISI
ncbi:MAG TPA: methyltransferase domain-containing protein [Patescibacteria group bacterium]|jgi:ubiquinone/menaquinone biosynthesis C-methylase UbiE|nr:methyltransferase domain-containing protein [Patescibacteria group bacterium]